MIQHKLSLNYVGQLFLNILLYSIKLSNNPLYSIFHALFDNIYSISIENKKEKQKYITVGLTMCYVLHS